MDHKLIPDTFSLRLILQPSENILLLREQPKWLLSPFLISVAHYCYDHLLGRQGYVMILPALGLILSLLTLSSCSSVPNTIAGLSTLQSTISGSNYVYFVDPSTGRLTPSLKRELLGEPIHAGEYFSVSLDFGFLRYLQAVDPYVIVYSETWMGKNPRPTDTEKTLRQIVLIKEGMAPNSRLPITNFPLLGPVTMGEDLLDVYVTLKVVVLSKHDNAESIKLVEGLATTASAAGPQYSALAGAAAATVAAFISQNKDKIEFEHTYVLSPDASASQASQLETRHTKLELREGQLITLKGESRYRGIPYPNWQYYLYPLNWFGTSPDKGSRKIETEAAPAYGAIGAVLHIPQSIIQSIFSTPDPYNYPIGFYDYTLSPTTALDPSSRTAVIPYHFLGSDGMAIVDCSPIVSKTIPPFLFFPAREKTFRDYSDISMGNCSSNVMTHHRIDGDLNESNVYVQKTHMAIRVSKSTGSLGTFQELVDHFSEHSKLISEVTTSSSDSRRLTNQRIDETFDSIQKAIRVERAKQAVREDAKAGILKALPEVGKENEPGLRSLQIHEIAHYTTRRIIQFAKSKKLLDPSGDRLFTDVLGYINTQRWDVLDKPASPHFAEWTAAWKTVLTGVSEELGLWQPPTFAQNFDPVSWNSLATGTCQGSPEMPSVSVSDISLYEGPIGFKKARFIVYILPKPRVPFNIMLSTVDGTATAGTHYDGVTNQPLAIDPEKTSYPLDITVHGNTVPQNNFATFNLILDLPASEKEKAFLCRGQAIAKILDGSGTISNVSPRIEANSVNGVTIAKIEFKAMAPNPEPIEFTYAVLDKAATTADDFARVVAKPIALAPNATTTEEITVSLPAETTKASVLVTPKSNNLNPNPVIVVVDVKK